MLDNYLQTILLKQRGDNQGLVQEVLEKLSPAAKERLYRVLQAMDEEVHAAERRGRMGWFRS